MPQFSRPRVLLAGLVAGLTIDSIEYLLDEFVSPQRWVAAQSYLAGVLSLGVVTTAGATLPIPTQPDTALVIALLQIVGLAAGFAGTLVAVRARALVAALFGWAVTFVPFGVLLFVLKLTTDGRTARELALFALPGLAACFLGVGLGKWVYWESEAASQRAAPASTVVEAS